MMGLIFYGDERLRQVAEEIEEIDEDIKFVSEYMTEIMQESQGVGLAGNQIGFLKRIITLQFPSDKFKFKKGKKIHVENKPFTMINPKIVANSADDIQGNEMCLSIPYVQEPVWRWRRVKVRWEGIDGEFREKWFEDLESIIVQHEIDHLNGILFIDLLPPARKEQLARSLKEIKDKFK